MVLADRGFYVEDSIAYMAATLNIPAFTQGFSQVPAMDVESTRKLANIRIHVERVIGAVRQGFKILSATTPVHTEYTRRKRGPVFWTVLLEFVVHYIHYCTHQLTLLLPMMLYQITLRLPRL